MADQLPLTGTYRIRNVNSGDDLTPGTLNGIAGRFAQAFPPGNQPNQVWRIQNLGQNNGTVNIQNVGEQTFINPPPPAVPGHQGAPWPRLLPNAFVCRMVLVNENLSRYRIELVYNGVASALSQDDPNLPVVAFDDVAPANPAEQVWELHHP